MTKKRTPHSSKRTTKKSKKEKVLLTLKSPVGLKLLAVKRQYDARHYKDYKIVNRPISFRLAPSIQVLLNTYSTEVNVSRNGVVEAAIIHFCSGQFALEFED